MIRSAAGSNLLNGVELHCVVCYQQVSHLTSATRGGALLFSVGPNFPGSSSSDSARTAREPVLDTVGREQQDRNCNEVKYNIDMTRRIALASDYDVYQDERAASTCCRTMRTKPSACPAGRALAAALAVPGGFGPGMILATQFLDQADKNEDGKLSKDEFAALADSWFDKLDPDKPAR